MDAHALPRRPLGVARPALLGRAHARAAHARQPRPHAGVPAPERDWHALDADHGPARPTRVRKLVNKAFTPKRIAALRGHIEAIVRELADEAQAKGTFDLIHDVAEPLPAIVIAELLGVPVEDHRQFRQWSSAMINGFASPSAEEARATGARRRARSSDYLADIIAARRRAPREDLISAMIAAQEERDALTDAELLATGNLLLLAGHETTTNLIGNGTLALLREPDQWERLCNEPALLPTAIEELLRYDGPVQATVRVALEDVAIDDHVIPEGSLVLVSIGSANHDPDMFDDPTSSTSRANRTRTSRSGSVRTSASGRRSRGSRRSSRSKC